ncbi:FeoC-like transcriptional regulator [Endothiovibrio diazotrophicus]
MIFSELRSYLKEHHRAAVVDLATRFDSSPAAVRGMLEEWERRGKVRRLPQGTACGGGCCKCAPDSIEIYQWCG